jgi:polysaccharide pyruvyl transferase WcaK-like protein
MTIKKFCIVNFTGLHKNWGCQATSWELLKFLNEAIATDPLPEFSYVPFLPVRDLDNKTPEDIHDIYAAIDTIETDRSGAERALGFLERQCRERYGFWADEARDADVIFFQAEGTMMGSTEFHTGARLFLLPYVAKRAWGKPVISLNQSLFGRDEQLLRAAAQVFAAFDIFALRESASLELARELRIKNACYVPDAAFLTRASPDPLLPQLDDRQEYFCLTGSALRDDNHHEKVLQIADRIRRETRLVPVLAAAKDTALVERAREVWSHGEYEVVSSQTHYPAIAHLLKSCKFLLGGRYHMAIMAAAIGTPSILLRGNTFKNEGLASMLRSPFPVRSVDNHEAIFSDALTLLSRLPDVRAQLREAVSDINDAFEPARTWLNAFFKGVVRDFSAFVEPPPTRLSQELIDVYCTHAEKGVDAKKFRKRGGAFGQRVPVEDLLEPLLAASQGDPLRTRTAVAQLLARKPTKQFPQEVQAQLDSTEP